MPMPKDCSMITDFVTK